MRRASSRRVSSLRSAVRRSARGPTCGVQHPGDDLAAASSCPIRSGRAARRSVPRCDVDATRASSTALRRARGASNRRTTISRDFEHRCIAHISCARSTSPAFRGRGRRRPPTTSRAQQPDRWTCPLRLERERPIEQRACSSRPCGTRRVRRTDRRRAARNSSSSSRRSGRPSQLSSRNSRARRHDHRVGAGRDPFLEERERRRAPTAVRRPSAVRLAHPLRPSGGALRTGCRRR